MKDNLIILGAAPCVFDDLKMIQDQDRFDFMAICKTPALEVIRDIKWFVTHEPNIDLIAAMQMRNDAGFIADFKTFSNEPYLGINYVVDDLTPPTCSFDCNPRLGSLDERNQHYFSGSSALLGVKVALRLGYKKIVITGAPLNEGRYCWFQKGWTFIADALVRCPIRGTSGFPMELLGKYTEEWFNER